MIASAKKDTRTFDMPVIVILIGGGGEAKHVGQERGVSKRYVYGAFEFKLMVKRVTAVNVRLTQGASRIIASSLHVKMYKRIFYWVFLTQLLRAFSAFLRKP